MITGFSDLIDHLIGARFGFTYLWELIVALFRAVITNGDVQSIWATLKNFAYPVMAFVPYALMLAGLIVAFFGKKMSGILKFIALFIVGFALGVHFLVPVMPPEAPIPAWIIGLVVAIVAAVLSKFLFVTTCSAVTLYSVYRLCYHGFFLDYQADFSAGKAITAIAVAVIVLILVLVFFKYVEMLIYSAFGAYMVTSGFALGIIDLGAIPKLGVNSWILELSVIGVIALIGFTIQVKTRRRY